jgi:hypothetical protein
MEMISKSGTKFIERGRRKLWKVEVDYKYLEPNLERRALPRERSPGKAQGG